MNARYTSITAAAMAFYVALVIGGAGTVFWTEGWLFLGALFSMMAAVLRVVAKTPRLLQERFAWPFQKEQKGWDKIFFILFIPSFLVWLPLNGFDAVRFRWSSIPWWLEAPGMVGLAFAFYVFYLTFEENAYAAPVVKLQKERGQHVVSTGPYAVVRHPMYAGAILMFPASSLLMGSLYGLAFCVWLALLFIVRTALEDRMLKKELAGYPAYAFKVRYRLIPGVW